MDVGKRLCSDCVHADKVLTLCFSSASLLYIVSPSSPENASLDHPTQGEENLDAKVERWVHKCMSG